MDPGRSDSICVRYRVETLACHSCCVSGALNSAAFYQHATHETPIKVEVALSTLFLLARENASFAREDSAPVGRTTVFMALRE